MIEIKQYSCAYAGKTKPHLHRVNLHIRAGEFVAVIGPSGGGKSTLLFSINGLIPNEIEGSRYEGSIKADGICVQETMPHDLAGIVGTVLQDPEWQLVRGTVLEELVFPLENMGVEAEEIDRRLKEVTEQVEIRHLLPRSPLELSGGQKQRVAIAACLMMRPKIIVLDEPTAELDPLGKEMVIETIRELNRVWGYTIVLVDHNLDVTLPHVDRVVEVEEGRIAADGTPAEVFAGGGVQDGEGRVALPQTVEIAVMLGVHRLGDRVPLTARELADLLMRVRPQHEPGAIREPDLAPVYADARRATGILTNGRVTDPAGVPAVELEDVHFAYGKTDNDPAIHPLQLRIRQGEFVAVIGQNGAGKSTLCKLMVGLLKPLGGSVRILGKMVSSYRAGELVKQVGYVFQNPDYQIFQRTVYDEVAYGLRIQKLPRREIERRVLEATQLLDIERHLREHPHFLSRGERRRVAIASMLALRPNILILDEPTTGLDPYRCRQMMEHIRSLWDSGHTVILLTHDMRVVADYVPRTIVMASGRIELDGMTRDVFACRDELLRRRITVPPVVELSRLLGWVEPALTSEEFVLRYRRMMLEPSPEPVVAGGAGV
ncbi:ABC transporter ATP-binding protein [Paenibacillus hamazuiensis]|uniref:ABC transporter ATP-binding protein n=1 Tax=Paenibacillus hamazuiensis TaxID=2936508 RepID=UPI00200E755C|nr:ABC transporter ATP-binding protein [Paenibacillus hamazuiensis]